MATALDSLTATLPPATRSFRTERRAEKRAEKTRIVEYSAFPRVAPQQRLRIGFTRDISRSGMCLGVDQSEPVGSLLRICLRDIEGRSNDACVGRVVWSSSEQDGRHWLGLELLTAAPTGHDHPARGAAGTGAGRSLFR